MNTHEIFKSSKLDVESEGQVLHGQNLMIELNFDLALSLI